MLTSWLKVTHSKNAQQVLRIRSSGVLTFAAFGLFVTIFTCQMMNFKHLAASYYFIALTGCPILTMIACRGFTFEDKESYNIIALTINKLRKARQQ